MNADPETKAFLETKLKVGDVVVFRRQYRHLSFSTHDGSIIPWKGTWRITSIPYGDDMVIRMVKLDEFGEEGGDEISVHPGVVELADSPIKST
jgi:hypothetical protein